MKNTPILVAAGQWVDRAVSVAALSPVDLSAAASAAAFKTLQNEAVSDALKNSIDTVVVSKLFMHSMGGSNKWQSTCRVSNNIPRSVANRLGLNPKHLIYAEVGGESPQRYVNTLAECIFKGSIRSALITGAEALQTMKHAAKAGIALDWSEEVDDECDNRSLKTPLATASEVKHGISYPIQVYALFEQARRARRGLSMQHYRDEIGSLLAPFAKVATCNPFSQESVNLSASIIATPTNDNYLLCEPYTKLMVAQDNVNQGASVVLTSVGLAEEIGIPRSQWVYLLAYADVAELPLLRRPDLSYSAAQKLAIEKVFRDGCCSVQDITYLDIYSCFPIAVFNACEYLGIDVSTLKAGNKDMSSCLTVTGGLPFFGGPGNNYSLHAIAEMVARLSGENKNEELGLVIANGGYMSKHSTGLYCTDNYWRIKMLKWEVRSSEQEQRELDRGQILQVDERPYGVGTIETYSALYSSRGRQMAMTMVIGRMKESGYRFLALVDESDTSTLASMFRYDSNLIGAEIIVWHDIELGINRFKMSLPPLA